jgi:hypothetical protein
VDRVETVPVLTATSPIPHLVGAGLRRIDLADSSGRDQGRNAVRLESAGELLDGVRR